MSPDDALRMQIERYRKMTPSERLRIGLQLHDLACNAARSGIRAQRPNATEQEVEQELYRRLEMARR